MFATINSNDKLEFIFTNETDEIIEDYVELDDKRDTHPITCVLVATSEGLESAGAVRKDQSLIDKYGENWLKIYDYAFAYSTEKCEQLIEAIFNQVKGFGYSSFKSEYSFLPYLTLGDKIKFKNKDGELVDSIILRYETSYDEITFEAPSITNASVDYELPETVEQKINRVSYKADQQNATIESLASTTENIKDNINNLDKELTDTTNQLLTLSSTVTQNNQSVQTQINQINTNLENGVERVKNTLVTIDINGIQVSTNVSKINSVMQNDKFAIQDNLGNDLIFIGYDETEGRSKAEMDNLTVTNYFTAGYHRQEKFEPNGEKRTGWFYVGGDI